MPVSAEFTRAAERFARTLDPELKPATLKSKRFLYFSTPERLVVVVPSDDKAPDWALVYGLAERAGRQLTLVLPPDGAYATEQRAPWLTDEARPDIWTFHGQDLHRSRAIGRDDTIQAMTAWANRKGGPTSELDSASRPLHLGDRKAAVQDLADWATRHPQLDAAHRRSERSWHVAGQRVLTFAATKGGGLRITAGIQDKAGRHSRTILLGKGETLDSPILAALQKLVLDAIDLRLSRSGPYPPDEHWLQSALRRDPSLVGVESPALREVPAWRPTGQRRTYSRGYLDLLGLDGQGDIRIVEAKIAKSTDEMTLFQGIDYVIWAHAYADALRAKLSAPLKASFHLHFVVGSMESKHGLLPPRIAKYADALDTTDRRTRYHFHVVDGWDRWAPDPRAQLTSHSLPKNTLPA